MALPYIAVVYCTGYMNMMIRTRSAILTINKISRFPTTYIYGPLIALRMSVMLES